MAIEFELDQDQRQLQDTVRTLFENNGGISRARAVMEDGPGWSRETWQQMVDMDLAGLTIPHEHGGSGGTTVDLIAVYMETGRALVASPHLASSVLAADMLVVAGSAAQKQQWLPAIARGEAIVVPALLEPSAVWDEGGIELRLDGGSELTLTGTKVLVPFAADADRLVVAARDGSGVTLVLVDPGAPGVTITPQHNNAGLPLFAVELAGVAVVPGDIVGDRGAGWAAVAPALARGAVLRTAEIAGAGERMLDLAVDYANQRSQFGTPIGRYQAVQYLCTDVAMESHQSGLMALRAAWLLDQGDPDAALAVASAKLYASRAATTWPSRPTRSSPESPS